IHLLEDHGLQHPVVISGGGIGLGPVLLEKIRRIVRYQRPDYPIGNITFSKFPQEANLRGALAYANRMYPTLQLKKMLRDLESQDDINDWSTTFQRFQDVQPDYTAHFETQNVRYVESDGRTSLQKLTFPKSELLSPQEGEIVTRYISTEINN